MAMTHHENARSESELIRRLRAQLAQSQAGAHALVALGMPTDLVDDMAAVGAQTGTLLWTVDMLMDDVDFQSGRHPWYQIGRKAMAVNLSDCAAMAARPISALCAVALNNDLSMEQALDLIRGAHELGLEFGCPVVGGDTNSWDSPTVISISIAAQPEPGCQPVRRDGARLGDHVYLTGPVGGSLLGRHMNPQPRIETALTLNRHLRPAAMIDVSDGLALDLWRILEASGCGATLDAAALDRAVHPDALQLASQDGRSPREHALHDGEDFELIVVLPPDRDPTEVEALGLLPLGRIDQPAGLFLQDPDGRAAPIERRGWEHFR
jgi:thiamine-monophosphate kinase